MVFESRKGEGCVLFRAVAARENTQPSPYLTLKPCKVISVKFYWKRMGILIVNVIDVSHPACKVNFRWALTSGMHCNSISLSLSLISPFRNKITLQNVDVMLLLLSLPRSIFLHSLLMIVSPQLLNENSIPFRRKNGQVYQFIQDAAARRRRRRHRTHAYLHLYQVRASLVKSGECQMFARGRSSFGSVT